MAQVECVYVPAENAAPIHRFFNYVDGMTVQDVLSQFDVSFPSQSIDQSSVGIFSKSVSMDTRLRPGDRVEIYRPLLLDPKERRRQRAVQHR